MSTLCSQLGWQHLYQARKVAFHACNFMVNMSSGVHTLTQPYQIVKPIFQLVLHGVHQPCCRSYGCGWRLFSSFLIYSFHQYPRPWLILLLVDLRSYAILMFSDLIVFSSGYCFIINSQNSCPRNSLAVSAQQFFNSLAWSRVVGVSVGVQY